MKKALFLLIMSVTLLLSSCYLWYQERVEMDTSTPQTTLSDFLHEDPEITYLNAPTQVIASQGLYSRTIRVRWDEVQNAKSYRIERAIVIPDENGEYTIPDDSDFTYLDKIVTNIYTDTIIKNEMEENTSQNQALYKNLYFYRISAENIINGYDSSEFTSVNEDNTQAMGWLLSAPENVQASKGTSKEGISISWTPVLNAKKYEIWRNSKDKDIGREKLATISANRTVYFNDLDDSEKGNDFYYQVKAIISSESESDFSSRVLGYSLKEGAAEPPANIKIINGKADGSSSFKISWDHSVPSDTIHTSITYTLFRSSSTSPNIKAIKNGITNNSYTDQDSFEEGVIYNYYLQAIATNPSDTSDFTKSPLSELSLDATACLLSPPTTVDIEDGPDNNTIILKWKPSAGYDLPGVTFDYNIYASQTIDGEFTGSLVNTETLTLDEKGFYKLAIQKSNYYKISTINKTVNIESNLSGLFAPTPNAPTNVYATKCIGGDLINFGTNTNEVYPVKITWNPPANDSPYGYYVYRSTKPDSSFRKLNEEPILANQKLEYIDENETARAGSYYYYKVISINSLLQGKKGNDPTNDPSGNARGYGALTREQWFREYNKTTKHSQTKLTLMHKSGNTDKLGKETAYGDISGTLYYNAQISGLSGDVQMTYTNYADYYIANTPAFGPYFVINGNTNTKAGIDTNGNMYGSVTCTGMYPGTADYGNLQIKGGAAGGGYYDVATFDLNGNPILAKKAVDWLVGEE